jgi:F-type H+-transporting ATPase subunit b
MVSISLDATFFVQIGLFLVLVYILNVLLYKPVLAAMEERGKKISGLETDASTIEGELEEKLLQYREEIAKAKEAGGQKRTVLKKKGLDREAELVGAAHAAAQSTISKAKESIARERDAALEGLRAMTNEMAQEIAEKALGRPL